MKDNLKQDTNTMLAEIEPYFEQIQEYLHYDEEQRLLTVSYTHLTLPTIA